MQTKHSTQFTAHELACVSIIAEPLPQIVLHRASKAEGDRGEDCAPARARARLADPTQTLKNEPAAPLSQRTPNKEEPRGPTEQQLRISTASPRLKHATVLSLHFSDFPEPSRVSLAARRPARACTASGTSVRGVEGQRRRGRARRYGGRHPFRLISRP